MEENRTNEENKEFDFDEFEEELENEEPKQTWIDKIKAAGGKAVSKVKDTGKWVINHPDEAVAIGGAVLGAVLVGKTVSSINKVERTVYDDHTGECVELKKKLTNADKVELDQRMSDGETKIEALDRMHKIKR